MTLDRAILQLTPEPVGIDFERGRLRQFADAIGETNPVYRDSDAARAAGHPDILAPPTLLFGLELENSNVFRDLSDYGVDLDTVLHGAQRFRYFENVHAGDRLLCETSCVDVHSKSDGALEFLVPRTVVTRERQRAPAATAGSSRDRRPRVRADLRD